MFTGIIQHQGIIVSMSPARYGEELIVDPTGWEHRAEAGESICVSGCCLTHAPNGTDDSRLRFEVVPQTLGATTLGSLEVGRRVNLEHAATPSTLLGGHLVQGHVDGVAMIQEIMRDGDEHRLRVQPPPDLLSYIVSRGSVALDGVSLTVASVVGDYFEVALIPTTLDLTTLGSVSEKSKVNLEVDCIAKLVAHRVNQLHAGPTRASSRVQFD